jgi:hypothetical protein
MMSPFIAWLPLLFLPTATILWIPRDTRWESMWVFAFAIFVGCKWLTWWTGPGGPPWWRHLGYLFAWPGMDAAAFLSTDCRRKPSLFDWVFAFGKLNFGAALLWLAIPLIPVDAGYLRGWFGMVGIVFLLHFGLFHLLSLGWQSLGVNAKPIMNWPIAASSVSEFWGQRWNLAFRDLTHRYLFRPLTARFGARAALAIGFLVSGVVHDLVISLPAGGGYGGPTLFFVIQAGAIFVERSAFGKSVGLSSGWRGWLFTMVVLAGPVMLLFHRPFVLDVVVPFVEFIDFAG